MQTRNEFVHWEQINFSSTVSLPTREMSGREEEVEEGQNIGNKFYTD